MIRDKLNIFSDDVALTATAISDVIDLGDDFPNHFIGGPDGPYLVLQTGTAFTDAGSDATLVASLVSDSTANLATSPTTHITTGTLAFSAVSAANRVLLVAPLPVGTYERYLGMSYTVASGPFTAGTIRAFLVRDPQQWLILNTANSKVS